MDNLNEQSKRKLRPAQRLYVPPARRDRKNTTMEENNDTMSVDAVDKNNQLQERLETLTISENEPRTPRKNETPQIDTNKKITKEKIDTTDAENEEMNRAMVNMNRKSSRPIIKHTTNYLPTNDVLQIITESERITDKVSNNHVANWEDLVNEDDERSDYKQNGVLIDSFNDNAEDDEDAEEAVSRHRTYHYNLSDLDHVVELYDFPSSFRTQDLITLYNLVNSDSSYIKWCDETHALLVVGTAAQALRALDMKHDIVKSRPVTLASSIALQTIEKCDLRPAMKRPQTSMHTARRMITSALGTKSNISMEKQKLEREALRKAKELKRTQKQNEQDAWEGNPRPSTA